MVTCATDIPLTANHIMSESPHTADGDRGCEPEQAAEEAESGGEPANTVRFLRKGRGHTFLSPRPLSPRGLLHSNWSDRLLHRGILKSDSEFSPET